MSLTGLLAGCVHAPPPPAPPPPNPFGYLKRSAVCTVGPVRVVPSQGEAVDIKTRSDDGACAIQVSEPGGGAYASFLLASLPVHGNSFIYNYNNQTYVTYTADTAYAGADSFTVSLVPGGGKPRVALAVSVSVDATGMALPAPVVAPKPVPKTMPHRRARRRPVHHG